MGIPFSARLEIAKDVLSREVDGEIVFLNLATQSYLGLDPIGARMWQLLTESATIQHAYDTLLGEYDVSPELLKADLNRLLDQIIEHRLARIVEAESPG